MSTLNSLIHHFPKSPGRNRLLSDAALAALPDCLLLVLDTHFIIRRTNECTALLLEQERSSIEGCSVSTIAPAAEDFCRHLREVHSAGTHSIAGVLEIRARHPGRPQLLVDIRIASLCRQAGSLIGYMITGNPLKGRQQFRALYRLSRREIEIVEEIIQGKTTPCIAAALSISERTVKTHITHIFRKLEVENRIQLYRLLRERDCISQQPADRSLLLQYRGSGCRD